MTRYLLAAAFVVLLTAPVQAIDGNEWLQLKSDSKLLYVAGAVGGWSTIQALQEHDPTASPTLAGILNRLLSCTGSMRYGDMQAIIEVYLRRNPQDLNKPINVSVWAALSQACERR